MKRPIEFASGVYMLEVPFPEGLFPPDSPPCTLCYLIKQSSGWLMIDSGFNHSSCFDALCEQLAALGLTLRDIRWLVITHFHPDHSGLASRIKAVGNPHVIMHRTDWDVVQLITTPLENWGTGLEDWAGALGMMSNELEQFRHVAVFGRGLFPVTLAPDILLEGEDSAIGDTGTLRALLTPGHTPGHISIYDKRNRFLFSGDHVLLGISSHITADLFGDDDMLGNYLDSLRQVRLLNVDLVLPAHEKPFTGLSRRVDELLLHHEVRLDQVLSAVGSRPTSPRDIASQVQWTTGVWDGLDGMHRILAIQETLAHLHLLKNQGQVDMVQQDGKSLYKQVSGFSHSL